MGKSKSHSISLAVVTLFALLLPAASVAETDPFPGLSYGDTIPGYEVWDYSSRTWEEFTQTDDYKELVCPSGSQLGGGPRLPLGRRSLQQSVLLEEREVSRGTCGPSS